MEPFVSTSRRRSSCLFYSQKIHSASNHVSNAPAPIDVVTPTGFPDLLDPDTLRFASSNSSPKSANPHVPSTTMFKSLAKDLSGTADICNTVTNFSKLQGAQYVLPQEEILFAFASAKEEFVFTNEALITVCGENAITTRKLVERYEYRDARIRHVQFETTGRVDRDCEIKFHIGEVQVSIDIAKKEEELVKGHYKALVALSREQHERARNWELAKMGLDRAADALHLKDPASGAVSLTTQASQALQWLEDDFARLNPRSYRGVVVPALPASGHRK